MLLPGQLWYSRNTGPAPLQGHHLRYRWAISSHLISTLAPGELGPQTADDAAAADLLVRKAGKFVVFGVALQIGQAGITGCGGLEVRNCQRWVNDWRWGIRRDLSCELFCSDESEGGNKEGDFEQESFWVLRCMMLLKQY